MASDGDIVRAIESLDAPALVASHFRSGTHLLIDLIRRNFPAFRPRMRPFESIHATYLSRDRLDDTAHRASGPSEALALLGKAPRSTLKTHALPTFDRVADHNRAVHTAIIGRSVPLYAVRDGRDVMCSMHAWMRSFRPDAVVDFERFCFEPLSHSGRSRAQEWNHHVLAWLDHPGVHIVRFDRIIHDTAAVIDELAEALSAEAKPREPALPKPIKSVRAAWLARALGRAESTNVHSGAFRPRKRNEVFDDRVTDRFFAEAGEAMARLRYPQ